jgi:SAM-dependent methyltransferase
MLFRPWGFERETRTMRSAANPLLRRIAASIRQVPGGAWVLGWADPLHLSHRLLHAAMTERAHYVHGRLLDLGCAGQPYRQLFTQITGYVGLDIETGPNVDVSADGQALPFTANCFDTVICNEVLEHVPEPALLLAEVTRVLKPGGVLLLTTPQTWGLHHQPHDYYRYTHYGLRYQAEKAGLQVVSVSPTCGQWATTAQRTVDTIVHDYAAPWPSSIVRVMSVLLAPVLLIGAGLDRLMGPRGDTLDNVLVAKKP